MVALGPYSLGQAILSKIAPDLFLIHVSPASFAGIEPRTAHSTALAVAEMVYRAVWKASNLSGDPPQTITSGDKWAWDTRFSVWPVGTGFETYRATTQIVAL